MFDKFVALEFGEAKFGDGGGIAAGGGGVNFGDDAEAMSFGGEMGLGEVGDDGDREAEPFDALYDFGAGLGDAGATMILKLGEFAAGDTMLNEDGITIAGGGGVNFGD